MSRPIFIIGCSRSGTTIFSELFSKHKQLFNWSESAQVLEIDYYNPKINHLKTNTNINLFDNYRIKLLFGAVSRLLKKRFVNKHPENSLRIEYLKYLFPDCIFIHIIRDGRATVASNIHRTHIDYFRTYYPFGHFPKPPNWERYINLTEIEQFSYQWIDIVQYIRDTAKRTIPTTDYIEIRYEDFCKEPHKICHELDLFCKLDHELRIYSRIPLKLEIQNNRWEKTINLKDKNIMISIIGELNQDLGYI